MSSPAITSSNIIGKLLEFNKILANVYEDKSYDPGLRITDDIELQANIDAAFKLQSQRYRNELRATMDLAMVKYNITAIEAVWLGTFVCLFVFVPYGWKDKAGEKISKSNLIQYAAYEHWAMKKPDAETCTIRAGQAVHDTVCELLQEELNFAEQKLTTRSWSLFMDVYTFNNDMKAIRPHIVPVWQKYFQGYKRAERPNDYHITPADIQVVQEVEVKLPNPNEEFQRFHSFPVRPVPKSHYHLAKDFVELERKFASNRNDMLKKAAVMSGDSFDRTRAWIKEQAAQIDASIADKHFEQMRNQLSQEQAVTEVKRTSYIRAKRPQIRPTAAQILREEAILKKFALEEQKQLESEANFGKSIRDNIMSIQELKLQEEEELDRARKARLKLTAQLSHEEAALARIKNAEEKRNLAKSMKEESKQMAKTLEDLYHQNELEKINRIQMVQETRGKAQEIQEMIVNEKKRAASILQSQLQLEKQRLQEEEKRERQMLARKIQQLKQEMKDRKQQRADQPTRPSVDMTSNMGILTEMSVSDLRQTLQQLREQHQRHLEEKRKSIGDHRTKFVQDLQQKSQFIRSFKSEMETRSMIHRSEIMSKRSHMTEAAMKQFKEVDKLQHKLELLRQRTRRSQ